MIRETSIFTRRITDLLSDDEYRELQLALTADPAMGDVVAGTGGVRKVRWARSGAGKRGGVRVIYFWARAEGVILMLYVYAKNEAENLTDAQKAALRKIIEAEYPRGG